MRVLFAISALLLNVGAATPPAPVTPHGPLPQLAPPANGAAATADSPSVCHDRIEQVRQDRGLPKLDRGTAAPDEPLLIAAVDMRLGKCSVMVMANDINDIRPLPPPSDTGRLRPAR
jgi:hypothetical protein